MRTIHLVRILIYFCCLQARLTIYTFRTRGTYRPALSANLFCTGTRHVLAPYFLLSLILSTLSHALQILSSVGFFYLGDGFGKALGDDIAAEFAAFGAHVNNPIGIFNKIQIVFNY